MVKTEIRTASIMRKIKFKRGLDPIFMDDDSFIPDDNPREWISNKKSYKGGPNVKQHYLICYVAIMAGYFPDDLFPTLKDKCIQYYSERNLDTINVKADTFYKNISSIENSKVKVYEFNDGTSFTRRNRPFTFEKRKYIDSNLIESVLPFIQQWYPTGVFFLQTLNASYILDEDDFYWIYRLIMDIYPIGFKHFFENNCPHLNYNKITSKVTRNYRKMIPTYINDCLAVYIRKYFPDAINEDGTFKAVKN